MSFPIVQSCVQLIFSCLLLKMACSRNAFNCAIVHVIFVKIRNYNSFPLSSNSSIILPIQPSSVCTLYIYETFHLEEYNVRLIEHLLTKATPEVLRVFIFQNVSPTFQTVYVLITLSHTADNSSIHTLFMYSIYIIGLHRHL